MNTMHDFNDLEYWANRWMDCFPCTYPPELFSYKTEVKEIEEGFWPFKRKKQIIVDHAGCARCGERIGTGHQCKDIFEYLVGKRTNG